MIRAYQIFAFVLLMSWHPTPAGANSSTEFVLAVYSPAGLDNTNIESQYVTGARLFFEETNRLGGVLGRKIKLISQKLPPPRDRLMQKLQEEDIKKDIQKNGFVSVVFLQIPQESEGSIIPSSLDGTPVLKQIIGRRIAGRDPFWLGESNSVVEKIFSNLAKRGGVTDTDKTRAMSEGFLTACGLVRGLRMDSDNKNALIQRFSSANVQSYCGYLSAGQIRYLTK